MLVTEFFDGAVEIGDADVDDQVIDEGLALDPPAVGRRARPPRHQAGQPARPGRRTLLVIDVAFAQVRPSPWREAVDLANMMLVLAVRTDAERVYQRALAYFTPDEIAEAFAAARGIASPTQLRSVMKQRRARPRRPVPRPGARAPADLAAALGPPTDPHGARPAGRDGRRRSSACTRCSDPAELPVGGEPTCGTDDVMILMAQAVPTATSVPCVEAMPAGWQLDRRGMQIKSDRGRFRLDAGENTVEVTLLRPGDCPVASTTEIPSDEAGMRRYEQPEQLPPDLRSTRTYLFDGGCVTYRFEFADQSDASLIHDADDALAFQQRSDVVTEVERRTGGLSLCGAGATPCIGGER